MLRIRVFALLVMAVLAATVLSAQVGGRVAGTVVDATGAAVPDAGVSLQMPGSGRDVFTARTAADGGFTLLSVPPAQYDLVVEAKGFVKKVVSNLKVDPNQTLDMAQVKVDVAGVTETVEVSTAATTVQTTNAEISTTITKTQISNLPIADRSPLGFLLTQVGVNSSRGSTTINGQRVSFTNVTLDGINIQDNYIRTNAMDFLPNLLLLDQVAEVTVSTSNASAAAGGGSGQVNFVTPSGTNQFHGNAYWQNRNNYFRANSFFNNKSGVPVSFLNLNQLGGSIGGHVIKNKLFFYTNYEAYRNRQQTTANRTILTPNARQGIYTYKDTAGTVHQVNILQAMGLSANSTMQAMLGQVPTVYNNFDVGDSSAALLRNTAGYLFKQRDNRTRDNLTLKGDYVLSTKNSFSLTYAYNRDILDRPDQDPTYDVVPLQTNNDHTKLLSSSWRWNPKATLTNEVRFGFNWAPAIFLDAQQIPDAFITGTTYTNPVAGILRTQGRNTDTYNFADNANWLRGAHTFSFGFQSQAIRVEEYNDAGITPSYGLGLGLNTAGLTGTQMPGASSADISAANVLMSTLAGLYATDTQTFNVSSRTSGYVKNYGTWRHDIQNNYALYLQDSWRLKRNVTVNLGVRWDYYPSLDERDALVLLPVLENNNPIQTILDPNGKLDFAGSAVGRPFYNASKRKFAPNLGVAWDPTGEGKWSIRAGYSLAFVNDNVMRAVGNAWGTNSGLTSTVTAAGLDGRVASGLVSVPTPTFKVPRTFADNYALSSSNAEALIDPGLVSPYVQQWNIGVQRTVKGTLFDLRYVGNHATKSIRGFDYNQVMIGALLGPFRQAANNGWLSQSATGTFDPRYNANIAGSVPTPFFDAMPNGGYLTNSSVKTYMQQGAVGELGNFYQSNGVNGNVNFYPNPSILGGNVTSNFSNSVYHGLQFDVTHRFAKGLQFQGNYVFSKVLSDANGDGQTDFEAFLDIHNTKIERRRVAGFDVNHVLKGNFYYELPFGQGQRFTPSNRILSKVIGGWNASGIFTMMSGNPFSVYSSRGTLNRNARSSGTNTADTTYTKGQLDQLFQFYQTGNGPYFFPQTNLNPTNNTAVNVDGAAGYANQVFMQPPAGTLGQLQRNQFSGPWVWTMDSRVGKITKITETKTLEFRADAINVFNHVTWYVGDQTITSTTFGKITSQFYGNRLLQFSLYLRF